MLIFFSPVWTNIAYCAMITQINLYPLNRSREAGKVQCVFVIPLYCALPFAAGRFLHLERSA